MQNKQQQRFPLKRKVPSPMDAIQAAIDVMAEAGYEDSDVTPEELKMAHSRFENAINYLAARIADQKVDDLWNENQQLRERITRLEAQINQLRGIANAQI